MRKKIFALIIGMFFMVFNNNVIAESQYRIKTHLDDDFESYTNDTTMFEEWNFGPFSGGLFNGSNANDKVKVGVDLSLSDGYLGSKAIQISTEVDSGVDPTIGGSPQDGGLGNKWPPMIYSIMGRYIYDTNARTDLSNYAGIRLWVKPGEITGDRNVAFRINMIESSTLGSEKWISPSYYLDFLDPNGEFIFIDFNEFYEYYQDSGEPLDLTSIRISFLWLVYENSVEEKSTATVWVDNIIVVPNSVIDDFEGYYSDADLQAAYPFVGVISGGTVTNTLNTSEGYYQSNAMQIDFNFASGDSDPWAYVGRPINNGNPVDWSEFNGISFWVKATTTGDSPQIIQFALHEGDTTAGNNWGDKMRSADIDVSTLNPDGQYVILNFNDFVDYSGYSGPKDDGVLDLSDIRNIYIFTKYSGTATQNSSIKVLIDDIEPVEDIPLPLDVIENFERFDSTGQLTMSYPWYNYVDPENKNDSVVVTLDETGGAGGSQAMVIQTNFSATDTIEPLFYAGGPVRPEIRNMSQYDSLRVWLKATETGETPQYIDIALHEGDSTGAWGDKMQSKDVAINSLDPAGQYVTLAFNEFVDYGGFLGAKDDGVLDLSDIRSIFIRVKYYGIPTQDGGATVVVDDITLIEGQDLATDVDVELLPKQYALYQNYPNPFNPVTTIRYDLPVTSDVQLIIYDILGREVTRLVSKKVDAGFHTVQWNGRDKYGKMMTTGVYFYLLRTDNFTKTKKLILLK